MKYYLDSLGNASLEEAKQTVDTWFTAPQCQILLPDENHYERVMGLMKKSSSQGAILSDAVLASYAIFRGAILYSNDSDFDRFDGLKWKNPL